MTPVHLALVDLAQLRQLLAEVRSEPPPALLDKPGLARALSCSERHVDGLRRRGLPVVNLGAKSVRFDLGDVVAWLKAHGGVAANTQEDV